jgi:hypothetical protein
MPSFRSFSIFFFYSRKYYEMILDVKEVKSMFYDPECSMFQVIVARINKGLLYFTNEL